MQPENFTRRTIRSADTALSLLTESEVFQRRINVLVKFVQLFARACVEFFRFKLRVELSPSESEIIVGSAETTPLNSRTPLIAKTKASMEQDTSFTVRLNFVILRCGSMKDACAILLSKNAICPTSNRSYKYSNALFSSRLFSSFYR